MSISRTWSAFGIVLTLAVSAGFAGAACGAEDLDELGGRVETDRRSAGQGFAVGGGGRGEAHPGPQGISPLGMSGLQIGDYHSLNCSTAPWSISSQTSTFSFNAYPWGNEYDANDYATGCGESLSTSRAEMVSVLSNYSYIYSGGRVTMNWYRGRDNLNFFSWYVDIPSPQSYGWDYWIWYSVGTWTGKFPHQYGAPEIVEPGYYYVTVTSPWGSSTIGFWVTFNFVHMSDTHIYSSSQSGVGDPDGTVFGAAMQQATAMNTTFVALTGDLVDFGAGGAAGQSNYNALLGKLSIWGGRAYADAAHHVPVYMIPGNHDPRGCRACVYGSDYANYDAMIDALMPRSDPRLTAAQQRNGRNYAVTVGNTLLIFMDSGYDAGINVNHPNGSGFTDAQWSWLTNLIGLNFTNKILFMHHPAVDASGQKCDSTSFGSVYPQDATITYHWADLLYLLRAHPELVVLSGHEHQGVVCDSYGTVVDRNAASVARAVQTGAGYEGMYRVITTSTSSRPDVGAPQRFPVNYCASGAPLVNGGFETTSGWSTQTIGGSVAPAIALQATDGPYAGSYYAKITNTLGSMGVERAGFIRQTFTVPSNATSLSYAVKYWKNSWGACIGVKLSGAVLESYCPGGQAVSSGWAVKSFNISAYRGQSVTLEIFLDDRNGYWSGNGDHGAWIGVDAFAIQ